MKKLILAITTLVFSVGVNAACNTASLKGEYGFGVVGGDVNSSCASVGTVLFKQGMAVATSMTGCGGDAGFQSATGTYQLGEYCVGQINFSDGSTAHFVLNKKLQAGQFFISQKGSLAFGTIFKQ